MATPYSPRESTEGQGVLSPLVLSSTATRSANSAGQTGTFEPFQADATGEPLSEYARQKSVPLMGRASAAREVMRAIEVRAKKSVPVGLSGELGGTGQALGRPMILIGRPEFAEWYERLGRWVGPFGTRTAQAELIRTWLETGEEGAVWLVGQLLSEQHADAISGSSRVLLRMRGAAAPHVVAALALTARSEAVVPAVTFLRIVRDLDAEWVTPWLPQISEVLQRLVDHFDKDVRLAALHTCIDLLPVEDAKRVLAPRRPKETDPELVELLECFLRQ